MLLIYDVKIILYRELLQTAKGWVIFIVECLWAKKHGSSSLLKRLYFIIPRRIGLEAFF